MVASTVIAVRAVQTTASFLMTLSKYLLTTQLRVSCVRVQVSVHFVTHTYLNAFHYHPASCILCAGLGFSTLCHTHLLKRIRLNTAVKYYDSPPCFTMIELLAWYIHVGRLWCFLRQLPIPPEAIHHIRRYVLILTSFVYMYRQFQKRHILQMQYFVITQLSN